MKGQSRMDNPQKLAKLGAQVTTGRQIKKHNTENYQLWLFTHDMRRNWAQDTVQRQTKHNS